MILLCGARSNTTAIRHFCLSPDRPDPERTCREESRRAISHLLNSTEVSSPNCQRSMRRSGRRVAGPPQHSQSFRDRAAGVNRLSESFLSRSSFFFQEGPIFAPGRSSARRARSSEHQDRPSRPPFATLSAAPFRFAKRGCRSSEAERYRGPGRAARGFGEIPENSFRSLRLAPLWTCFWRFSRGELFRPETLREGVGVAERGREVAPNRGQLVGVDPQPLQHKAARGRQVMDAHR